MSLLANRKRLLVCLGVGTLSLLVVLYALDRRMQHAGGPGIIGFEFGASRAGAARIMAEWGSTGRDAARLSLWIDFAYLVAYGSFFTLAGLATRDLARVRGWTRVALVGSVVPYFAAGAAVSDTCEDVALLVTLGGHGGGLAPGLATAFAIVKFGLIAIAIGYVLIGLFGCLRPAVESPG